MRSILLLILVPLAASADPLSKSAGLAMYSAFHCESKGSQTQKMIDSIGRLKAVVSAISGKEKECQSVVSSIGQIPDIESIIRGIEADSVDNEIREQESLINEFLSDLARIRQLPIDHPDRDLYPSEDTLRNSIRTARESLVYLRARLGVERAYHSKRRFMEGISQLESLTTHLSTALSTGQKCFQNQPEVKQQLFQGLIGVAGFFLKAPLGVATNLAGRLLQNVFRISSASRDRVADSFRSLDKASILTGLGCALENLGRQHCRIIKERQLFQSLHSGATCITCAPSEGGLQKVLQSEAKAIDAIKLVEKWSQQSSLSGDSNQTEKRNLARQRFTQSASALKRELLVLEETLKSLPEQGAEHQKRKVETLRSGVFSSVTKFYSILLDTREDVSGQNFLTVLFLEDEKEQGFMNLLYDENEDVAGAFQQLKNEATSVMDDLDRSHPDARSAYRFYVTLDQKKRTSPAYLEVAKRLEDPEIIKKVSSRLESLSRKIERLTEAELSRTQKEALLQQFIVGQTGSNPSPLRALRDVRDALSSAPQDFRKKYGQRTGYDSLMSQIDAAIAATERAVSPSGGDNELDDFFTLLNETVGRNQELLTRMNTLFNYFKNFESSKLADDLKGESGPDSALRALFLLNRDVLEESIGLSKNPSSKLDDFANAQLLSAAQLEGFTKFSTPYMDSSLEFLKQIKSPPADKPSAIQENLDGRVWNLFCMQLLSATEIPAKSRELCKFAKLKSGSIEARFSDYVDKPHTVRACVHYDFLTRERAMIEAGKQTTP